MSKIFIGKAGARSIEIDLDLLLRTRLLVQANSGGGKSWLLRRLAEQAFGKIPIIIIDPEGEFATLREKFGFVLAGRGGETPADPRSAELLAKRLLELRASAVCDLYEMRPSERHRWVRLFLEALIDAPKSLWRPTLVVVDEAHTFCPEKGASESEASDAMTALPTRGRKRRFCAVWATQRLGKLRKDASAELLNRLIGPTFEDVDLKRAADLLSIRPEDRRKFDAEMRILEPGNFYALGRAICKERTLVRVGPVQTSHEIEQARFGAEAPPPPGKVKALLPKLADLPKQAEEQAKTVAEFRAEIRSLKAQLRTHPKPSAPVQTKVVTDPRAINRAVAETRAAYDRRVAELDRALARQAKALHTIAHEAAAAAGVKLPAFKPPAPPPGRSERFVVMTPPDPSLPAVVMRDKEPRPAAARDRAGADHLKAGALRMLRILAQWHPEPRTRDQVGILAGFAPTGGTFSEYLAGLRRSGYVVESGDSLSATDEGLARAGHVPAPPNSASELVAMWKGKFKAGIGRMLDALVEAHPDSLTRAELGDRSGFAPAGGTFSEYLGALRRARLIEERGEHIRAAESLFP